MTHNSDSGDRRPLKTRATAWANAVADVVTSTGITPNGVSALGLVFGLLAGALFAMTSGYEGAAQRILWLGGAVLVQMRLLANLLDGMVAERRGLSSPVGELYNEIPDRLADATVLIGLGYAAGGCPILGYAAALVAVFVAYVRAMGKAAGAPNDFCGPFAKPHRMALVTALALYLTLRPQSWSPDCCGEATYGLGILIAGSAITAIRRMWRAGRYLRSRG